MTCRSLLAKVEMRLSCQQSPYESAHTLILLDGPAVETIQLEVMEVHRRLPTDRALQMDLEFIQHSDLVFLNERRLVSRPYRPHKTSIHGRAPLYLKKSQRPMLN
jgi:hypothetical protein